jgi:hypothetical protein
MSSRKSNFNSSSKSSSTFSSSSKPATKKQKLKKVKSKKRERGTNDGSQHSDDNMDYDENIDEDFDVAELTEDPFGDENEDEESDADDFDGTEIKLGVEDATERTKSGKVNAVKKFNEHQDFLKQPHFQDLTEKQLCNPDTFRRFGEFLLKEATTLDKNGFPKLKRDTAVQYLSGVKGTAYSKVIFGKHLKCRSSI